MLENELIKEFLNYLKIIKNYSDTTIHDYNTNLSIFFNFLKFYFETDIIDINLLLKVKNSDLFLYQVYLNIEKNLAGKSREHKMSTVRTFYNWLLKFSRNKDLINPSNNLSKIRNIKTHPKYFTLDQAKQLIEVFNAKNCKNHLRDNLIISIFLNCGLRMSELINLNIEDFNENERYLRIVGKGRIERKAYLNNKVFNDLKKYLKNKKNFDKKDPLFTNKSCKRISKNKVSKICKDAYSLITEDYKEYNVHSLRHTFATIIYKNVTKDYRIIQELLGHSCIEATQIYVHLEDEDMRNITKRNPLSSFEIPKISKLSQKYKNKKEKKMIKHTITLLDSQVELILKSLEFQAYTFQYIYPRSGRPQTKEEELKTAFIIDTYEQILASVDKPISKNPIMKEIIKNFENKKFH